MSVYLRTVPELNWDEFGSIHRPRTMEILGVTRTLEYVDLRQFDDCHVIPIGLPANLHCYWNDDRSGISVDSFVVKSRKFKSVYDIHCYLVRPGIHYILYAMYHDAVIQLRWHTVEAGTKEHDNAVVTMMSVADRLKQARLACQVDPGRFPHTCPRCRAPAYVGFSDVDCSRGCR